EFVERIRSVTGTRAEVIYEPDLLPVPRYVADHKGGPLARTAEQSARWRDAIGRADIMWDFPASSVDGPGGIAAARRLRWVQTTSTGVGQLVTSLGLAEADILVTPARGGHA